MRKPHGTSTHDQQKPRHEKDGFQPCVNSDDAPENRPDDLSGKLRRL